MASGITSEYDKFDGDWYLTTYYNQIAGCEEEGDFLSFMLKGIHDVFKSGDIKGENLLDIGTGPTIHSVISAAPYVQNIYLSDYSKINRNILNEWVEGKRNHGKDICKYCLQLESSSLSVEERFTDIRGKVRSVCNIDVTKWPMVAEEIPKPDVIVASLCFEAACGSLEDYKDMTKRLYQFLPSGGHLLVTGVLDETFYKVGDLKFYCLKINENELKEAFKNNGFDIKMWQEFIPPPRSTDEAEYSDFQKAFVMYAKKL